MLYNNCLVKNMTKLSKMSEAENISKEETTDDNIQTFNAAQQ